MDVDVDLDVDVDVDVDVVDDVDVETICLVITRFFVQLESEFEALES